MELFKKILMGLGAVFLVLIVVVSITSAYFYISGRMLDKSSQAYANAAVPAFAGTWDSAQLEARSHESLKKALPPEQMQATLGTLRTIGKMKTFAGCQGQSGSRYALSGLLIRRVGPPTAVYLCEAEFENGPATIRLNLVKEDKDWQIGGMNVDSKFFGKK